MAAIATAQPKSQVSRGLSCHFRISLKNNADMMSLNGSCKPATLPEYLAGRSEARLCEGHMCHGHLLIKRRKTRQAERVTASVSNYKQLIGLALSGIVPSDACFLVRRVSFYRLAASLSLLVLQVPGVMSAAASAAASLNKHHPSGSLRVFRGSRYSVRLPRDYGQFRRSSGNFVVLKFRDAACPPPPPATSQRSSPVASTAPTPSPLVQSQKQPSFAPSSSAVTKDCSGVPQPNMYGRSLGDSFRQESPPRQEQTPQPQLGQLPRAASPLTTPSGPHSSTAHHQPNHYVGGSCLPGIDCQEADTEPYGEGHAERLWNFSGRGSLSFDDLIAQVQKLLHSNSTSSSASSASTPRRPSGRLGEIVDVPGESKTKDNRSTWARRPILGRPPEQQQQHGTEEGREIMQRGEEEYSGGCIGRLDLHVLQEAAASQRIQAYGPGGDFSSLCEPFNEGVTQHTTSYIDPQAFAVLQELHRTAVQQRVSEAKIAVLRQENADLRNRITLLEETQTFLQQQNQSLRAAQHSAEAAGSSLGESRPATNKSATSRLLTPSGYQGPDQIQSAPNPSTPIIKGSDKISVEQFLLR
ncbi:putative KH domain protein [Toxoplasma gondii MAS]|uniref:Putative KH domain protein n=1 Tax=Toxoplasma gondii MAS TaxID=943118 RepID=A0A086PM05_TOXGO|nr:putative KH domain protein [Toxoplasma gondii MAS]